MATQANAGLGVLLKGEAIAKPFRDEVISSLSKSSRKPRLVGILAAEGPSRVYAEFTKRTCEDIGVEFILREIGSASKQHASGANVDVEEAIIEANEDSDIDGIMVTSHSHIYTRLKLRIYIGLLPHLWRAEGPVFTTGIRSSNPA